MSFFKPKTSAHSPSGTFRSDHEPFFKPQAKLKVGEANDKYENEADAVADNVVNKHDIFGREPFFKPVPKIRRSQEVQKSEEADVQRQENGTRPDQEEQVQQKPISESITPLVQKKEADDEPVQTKEEESDVQRQAIGAGKGIEEEPIQKKEDEENIQSKENGSKGGDTAHLESQITSSKGGGRPMDPSTKDQMESGFGADFSDVRIHNDSNAVQMNQNLGAKAFANGNDIYFNEGNYNPSSKEGQHLLAHELTHTIQQGGMLQKKESAHSISPTSNTVQGGFWGRVWGGIKNVGSTLWSGAKKIGGAFESVWKTATQYVGKSATWLWEGLKSLGSSTWSWLKAAGSKVWEAIKWFGSKSWEMIKTLGVVLWEKLVWLGQNAWSFTSNLPRRAWRLIVHSWEGIKGAASWVWSGLKGGAKHVWKAVKGTFNWIKDGFSGLLSWLGDGLSKGAAWAFDFIKSPSLSKLWDGLLGSLSWLGNGVKGFAKWGWRGIQGAAIWAWEGVSGLAGWIWDGIVGRAKWLGKQFMLILDLLGVGEALQIIWGLIFRMRKLTPGEISASLMVHPPGMIPYNLIRVDENSIISSLGGSSAVTTMHIIHSPVGGILTSTMVHELTHVAQYENVGSVYMAEAIHAQQVYGRTGGGLGSGEAYDYTRMGSLVAQRAAGRKYKDLNREAQAQLVQDYYDQLISSFTLMSQSDYQPFINDMKNGEF